MNTTFLFNATVINGSDLIISNQVKEQTVLNMLCSQITGQVTFTLLFMFIFNSIYLIYTRFMSRPDTNMFRSWQDTIIILNWGVIAVLLLVRLFKL